MRPIQKRSLIHFPIDGLDIEALAAGGTLTHPSWSRATMYRRRARMHQWGLTDADGGIRPDHPFILATAPALEERHDLPEILLAPSGLTTLASLAHIPPDFPAHAISGLTQRRWRTVIQGLHEQALVLRRGREHVLNPSLPALENLVTKYRLLHEAPPGDDKGWSPFFQRGIETFWRVHKDTIEEPTVRVGPGAHELLQPLASPYAIAYLGPRRLEPLDHVLITVKAEAGISTSHSVGSYKIPFRETALLAALGNAALFQRPGVRLRMQYYGLEQIRGLVLTAFESQEGRLWDEMHRFHSEFGVTPGALS